MDCGDVEPIIEKIGNRKIAGVLLTHAHFDHIYGLPELLKLYPNCKIYTNEIGRETLSDARLNMSLYHETPLAVEGPQVQICGEGEEIPVFGNLMAKVFETPGHHPSCLTFEVEDYLFTGDAYIPGVKVVTNLPGGNKEIAKASKDRIEAMMANHQLCAGHSQNES